MNIEKISFHPATFPEDARFSILIPSWNNLPFLKMCIESILKNSRFEHQIIVHLNDGSDGSLAWVKEQGFSYSLSADNVGVCYAFNAAASLARLNHLLLIDDDNYVLPDWDFYLWEEIQNIGHHYFSVSGTKIEPKKTFNPCVIAPRDFGSSPDDFNEVELLENYKSFEWENWNGSSWYPLVVHKKIWDLVGGLSTEFTPGMYSDPDFMMKLWQVGVRYFKGVSASRSYHFISKSVRRIKKNNGRKQFLKKWGISNSTFREYYLRMGTPFMGELLEPEQSSKFKLRLLRDSIKLFFSA
jgi:glycosyltransferase involved in cell wall biosynthesis